MIKEISLDNWKSYTKSTLFVDPLTFIIGINASGKSNLLDAFSCLSKLAQGRPTMEVVDGIRGGKDWLIREGQTKASLAVVVAKDAKDIPFRYEVEFSKVNDRIEICRETLKNDRNGRDLFWTNPVVMGSPTIDTRFYTAKRGHPRRLDLGRNTSVLSQIESLVVLKEIKEAAAVVLQSLQSIFILNPIPNNMRGYAALSTMLKEDASNIAGVLAGLEEHKKADVEQKLSKYLKNLPEHDINRVWTEIIGRFKSDAMLYCEENWTLGRSNIVDSRGMSDGTLRFLAIVTALMTMVPGSLLIVEEVDNGLHPSRAKELVNMLTELSSENKVDVLCTTHNPVLMDELGIDMLSFISYIKRDPETGGSMIELLEEKSNIAKLMSQHSMGDLMVEDCL